MVRLSIHTLPPSTHPSPSSYVPLRPAEVECVPHRPCFLSLPPSHREPFYIPGHEVLSPKIRSGEEGRTVVYTNQPGWCLTTALLYIARGGGRRERKREGEWEGRDEREGLREIGTLFCVCFVLRLVSWQGRMRWCVCVRAIALP